jgi:Ca2+-binding EF-hand superfamily protein
MRTAVILGAALSLTVGAVALAQTSGAQTSNAPADAAPARDMHGWRDAKPVNKADAAERRHALFARLDKNGDGKVTADEMAQARADMQARHVDRMFARLDADHDGKISRDEAMKGMDDRAELRRGRHGAMLAKLDKDGDGAISAAEFDAAGDARFYRMDRNGDGVITPDERRGRHGRHADGGPR